MATVLRLLSYLCWLCGGMMFILNYYFPFNAEGVQPLWDYVADPIILATFILTVVFNVRLSLALRNRGKAAQALPLDIFTMIVGFTGALYMHNYALKFAEGFEASQQMWTLLSAAVIVIMPVSGINYWRESKRASGDLPTD